MKGLRFDPCQGIHQEDSDPGGAESWLQPTPSVQLLNLHHRPSQSIKSRFQIK